MYAVLRQSRKLHIFRACKKRADGGFLVNNKLGELGVRDEFTIAVKLVLAMRVGLRCSNPRCRKATSGPQSATDKAVNIGVAAHISAASPGGPRFDPRVSAEQRSAAGNGIWLCQNCAKLIDNDAQRFTVEELAHWKFVAEQAAGEAVEGSAAPLSCVATRASQSSQILSFSRSFFTAESVDDDQLRDTGRQLHRLITYAFQDTYEATGLDRFIYLASFVMHPPSATKAGPTISVYVACHITPFVAAFQDLVETFFDQTDGEYLQRTAHFPTDLKISLSYAWRHFTSYEISRIGPKAIRIRLVEPPFLLVRFPMTTSDLLILLSVMHLGGSVAYDDINFSEEEVAFMKYTRRSQERGTFSLSDFIINKENPELWTVKKIALSNLVR